MPQNECARSPRPALYLSLALALSLFLSFALPAKCVLMFSKETQNFASGNAAQHLKYLSILLGSCPLFSFGLCACRALCLYLCLSHSLAVRSLSAHHFSYVVA